jgi:AcrR family transcriptional regulator
VGGVKTRPYTGTRRLARTRKTRQRVLAAAHDLFVEHGYATTSMEAISAAAEIAPATLYRLFTSKRALLKEVIDLYAVGDDEPVALHDRPEIVALRDERDPAAYLTAFAHVARVIGERMAPLQQMLRAGAAVDPDMKDLLATVNQQRYTGQGFVTQGLVERQALRDGLSQSEAHDTIYALMSPELRGVLMNERGLSGDQYETWLAHTLIASLLR